MGHLLDYELFQPSRMSESQIQEEIARYCREQRAKYIERNRIVIDRKEVTPGSTWRHVKTGSTYTVEGFTICSTNGEQNGIECVSYISHTFGARHHRKTEEFLDGRFVKESP